MIWNPARFARRRTGRARWSGVSRTSSDVTAGGCHWSWGFLTLTTLFGPLPEALAATGDVSVGVGAALMLDLPDLTSVGTARFGPGPSLHVPVRWSVASSANLRLNARGDFSTGANRISWARGVDGQPVRFFTDDQRSLLVAAGLTAGPEVVLPVKGSLKPYFGAGAGAAWVGTYHALVGNGEVVRDPGTGSDPSAHQLTFLTDLTVGGTTSGSTAFWFELGYSNAWVGAGSLTPSAAELDARREAFGWNAARAGLGVAFSL